MAPSRRICAWGRSISGYENSREARIAQRTGRQERVVSAADLDPLGCLGAEHHLYASMLTPELVVSCGPS
jgi:hypothetical protein